MEDDIISILFEKKIDSDMFNFSSEELTRWEKAKGNTVMNFLCL